MDSYTDFANTYDIFMDETPYAEWAAYIDGLILSYGASSETQKCRVAELGCGTGAFTMEMAARGYDMVGTDLSPEMLSIAVQKREEAGLPILYLEQDMCELELGAPVPVIVSVCDSVNYLLSDEDFVQMLTRVKENLTPGGIFIYDFNTEHKYRDVIGDTTIAESREDCAFIWENFYDEEERINEYDLTLFQEEPGGLFKRSVETHLQRGFCLEEMLAYAEQAGLTLLQTIDADTHEVPTEESERIYVVLRNE